MLRDRLGGTATKGRASPEGSLSSIPLSGFLQHTPSVSEVHNRGGLRCSDWTSRRGGCHASRPTPLKETGLRTCANCPGRWLALGLHIV